jgi:hypothetical protein
MPRPGEKLPTWHGQLPQYAVNLEIIPVESQFDVADFDDNPHTVDFYLPPLKPRIIDPGFIDEAGVARRLSECDPSVSIVHTQQQAIMQQGYVARVLMSVEHKNIIDRGIRHNSERWPELLAAPRMDRERFGRVLGHAATGALTRGMVGLTWMRKL